MAAIGAAGVFLEAEERVTKWAVTTAVMASTAAAGLALRVVGGWEVSWASVAGDPVAGAVEVSQEEPVAHLGIELLKPVLVFLEQL